MFFGTPKWSSKADNVYFLLGVSFSLNFYFFRRVILMANSKDNVTGGLDYDT